MTSTMMTTSTKAATTSGASFVDNNNNTQLSPTSTITAMNIDNNNNNNNNNNNGNNNNQQNEQQTAVLKEYMATIVSYPVLLSQEEIMTNKTPHDVNGWCLYLQQIDDLLEILDDYSNKNKSSYSSTTKKKKHSNKQRLPSELGGRSLINVDPKQIYNDLIKVRLFVAERAVTLLPGSYKIWRNHLHFRIQKTMKKRTNKKKQQQKIQQQQDDNDDKRFHTIVTSYEQCLIRLHKCPRIWLEYIDFVCQYNRENIATIRRLNDRALLALPITQHDRIWKPYLQYILQSLPDTDILKQVTSFFPTTTNTQLESSKTASSLSLLADNNNNVKIHIPTETIIRVMRRYVTYDPMCREVLGKVCEQLERWGECATSYLDILNDPSFISPLGSSRHDLWMKLAEICTLHPHEINNAGIDFNAIVRAALPKGSSNTNNVSNNNKDKSSNAFAWTVYDNLTTSEEGGQQQEQSDTTNKDSQQQNNKKQQQLQILQNQLGEMEGTLWTKLADYYIRSGEFELARSIYEESLESVSKVRDFSIIYDAYVKFEEGVIEAMMALQNDDDDDEEEESKEEEGDANNNENDDDDWDILLGDDAGDNNNSTTTEEGNSSSLMTDIELALVRAEQLTLRRSLLLNRVLLRQNPHNVGEWIKRSDLYIERNLPQMAIATLEESIQEVIAKKAVNGTPCQLVIKLSNICEENLKDTSKARDVYNRICYQRMYQFRDVDDLAQCYASWIELELRLELWDDGLSIARRCVLSAPEPDANKVEKQLTKSLRLWDLLLDLEESLGTVQTTKDAYNRALELRVATPMHIMNYASFLKDQKYYEESFAAYEKGVELFAFPHDGAQLLWKNYLTSFIDRYKGTKVERVRDLFERCLEHCPPEVSSEFYMLNGDYEETYGLTKRALGVYRSMCMKVPEDEKYTAYQLYIAKTIKYLGITATRDIYQEAIKELPDKPAAQMCLDFAKMESSLHEIDRARTVLSYGSQMADPRRHPEYWQTWHEFEVSHGNEETFREMLRIKRSVQAAFSTVNYNAAEMGSAADEQQQQGTLSNEDALKMIAEREGIKTNQQPRIGGFVQGKRTAELAELGEVENRVAKLRKATASAVVVAQQEQQETAETANAGDNNDDEIDLDDDDDEEEDDGPMPAPSAASQQNAAVRGVSTKVVPAAVFGGLASSSGGTDSAEDDSSKKMGALERLRAAAASRS